ncbi:MAG TPA: hypothetical protein VGS80_07210 [Ktedonobacterales bacterium]|nr:hypothetical protein [Ktedonobacterales bacterium]
MPVQSAPAQHLKCSPPYATLYWAGCANAATTTWLPLCAIVPGPQVRRSIFSACVLRAQGGGRLRLGRQVSTFRAIELSGEAQLPILRAYFERWWPSVRRMTPVTSPHAPDEEIMKAAPLHPVFRLEDEPRVRAEASDVSLH